MLGRRAWVPRGLEPAPPHVRLLPMFDSYLLGHRDRSLIVRDAHARAVTPGGGILAATLVVDGRIEGTWKLDRGRPAVTAFGAFDYEDEVDDVVRFRARGLTLVRVAVLVRVGVARVVRSAPSRPRRAAWRPGPACTRSACRACARRA